MYFKFKLRLIINLIKQKCYTTKLFTLNLYLEIFFNDQAFVVINNIL